MTMELPVYTSVVTIFVCDTEKKTIKSTLIKLRNLIVK